MKLILVAVIAGLCALTASYEVPITKKQKQVLLLLSHINQPAPYPEFIKIAQSFNVSQQAADYSVPEAVRQFELYDQYYGWLSKGEIFSVSYPIHLNQSIVLFDLLYYAKTYDIFFETAAWAREYFNEGLFLYSLSLAVIHRPDLQQVILPPIYEIYPYYFYNVEVIQEAYQLKQKHNAEHPPTGYDHEHGYTIYANYSGHYLNLHPEQSSLSYYLEDVGINSFYYYYQLYYPFWMSGDKYVLAHAKRGEQYLFLHQQLVAKYYLERLSKGFGEIPFINWELPFETPYYPSLEYPNGLEFPNRPPFVKFQEEYFNYGQQYAFKNMFGYSYTFIVDIEMRISSSIDKGYVYAHGQKISLYDKDGLNILGNLIQGNPESPDSIYYGVFWLFGQHLLGYSYTPLDPYKVAPAALEHFETALRDPAFYQLYKKIIFFFYKFMYNKPFYTYDDLVFHGVEIVKAEFDKLETYEEKFYSDISNAVYDTTEEMLGDSFHIRVAQDRLNHKPFNYKITVESDKAVSSVVKMYIAPLYDEYHRYINFTENYENAVIIDYFVYDLKAGTNVISRSSYDSFLYGKDPLSYHEILQQTFSAEGGKNSWSADQYYYTFPQRYMLPQGTASGFPVQFYIVVYPYVPDKTPRQNTDEQSGVPKDYFYPFQGEKQFYDSYPLLYPFDRPVYYEKLWHNLPNFYSYETKVYHDEYVNVAH